MIVEIVSKCLNVRDGFLTALCSKMSREED